MTAPVEDRRAEDRYAVNLTCVVAIEDRAFAGRVVNISRTGCAVLLHQLEVQPPPSKAVVEADIARLGKVRAQVARQLIGGIGLEFAGNDERVAGHLEALIEEFAKSGGSVIP